MAMLNHAAGHMSRDQVKLRSCEDVMKGVGEEADYRKAFASKNECSNIKLHYYLTFPLYIFKKCDLLGNKKK